MLRQIPIRTATAAPSRLLFRPSSVASTRLLTTEATSASQTASAPPPTSPASSTTTPRQKQLSYIVERTPSKNLSVYNDARAGGTRKQTVVKKIVGDSRALRDEIVEELQFPRDDVKINPVTGHVKIKVGHAVPSPDGQATSSARRARTSNELTVCAGLPRGQGAEMVGGTGFLRCRWNYKSNSGATAIGHIDLRSRPGLHTRLH